MWSATNLKAAGAKVLGYSENETRPKARCLPVTLRPAALLLPAGIEGAHEKSGVENQIGWFGRNHQDPGLEVDSLAELNAMVGKWDADDLSPRVGARSHTIVEHFAIEEPSPKPLPDEPRETGRWLISRVDRATPRFPFGPVVTRARAD